jgi:endonuclease/exonuclease/phosphatase (EEP) superfamily protein YafD
MRRGSRPGTPWYLTCDLRGHARGAVRLGRKIPEVTPSCRGPHDRSWSIVPLFILVMTYNLNYANPNFDATLAAIAAADADLVLLQEVSEDWRDALTRRFAARYPYRAFHLHAKQAGGLAVLSKVPLVHDDLWPAPAGTGAWYPAERLVVTAPFGALQLLNVHLRPALDRGSWVRGFLTTPNVRRDEIAAHWRKLDPALPTIVAGDFNEDPTGRAVDFLVSHGMTRVRTAGPTTWRYQATSLGQAYDLLKLDIDHVMIDRRLGARDAHVRDAGTSDHRPVIVTIAPT